VADRIPEPPSTYWHRQVYGCFFRDRHGLESLDEIGEDNVTFETDYPHTDSTWPHTRKVFAEQVEDLDPVVVEKIARGNAIRMLRLDPTTGRWRP
jgi:predicted TIM-barrel fold metal-dependent hydrolase